MRRKPRRDTFESHRAARCDVCGQAITIDAPGWATLGDGTLLHYGRGKDCIDRHWANLGIGIAA